MQEASMSGIRLSLLAVLLLVPFRAQADEPQRFRGKTLEQWRADLHSPHPEIRRRAATALGLGPFGNAAVPALLEGLKDADTVVKSYARSSLVHLGPTAPDAAPAIVPWIAEINSVPIARGHRESEFYINVKDLAPSGIPLLLERIRQEQSLGRFDSTRILDGVGRSAVPLLRGALSDGCGDVRAAAASGLEELGNDAAPAVPELLAALKDENSRVRNNAIKALGSIRCRDDLSAPLAAFLHGKEADAAALGLARLGPKGLAVLRQAYYGDSDELRRNILDNLPPAGPAALPLLLDGLTRKEDRLRLVAANGLATGGTALDRELPSLLAALGDANANVRCRVVSALGEVVPPRRNVVLAITGMLTDNEREVRDEAQRALHQLGRHARPAIPLLLEMLRHDDLEVRSRAVQLLADIAPPDHEVVLALCDSLKDDFSHVRAKAARALGNFGPQMRSVTRAAGEKTSEIVVAALLDALRDREGVVRVAAASALVKIGYQSDGMIEQLGKEVLDPWSRLLRLGKPISLSQAAAVLHELGPKAAPAMPMLMLALYDDEAIAIEPLGAMGPAARPAIPALERMLDPPGEIWEQIKIARALLQIGGDGPGIIRSRLESQDERLIAPLLEGVRIAGAKARELRPDLLRLMHHSSESVRWGAISALSSMGARGEDVVNALLRALKDDDENVRMAATIALPKMGAEAKCAIPRLIDLLIQRRPVCRQAVVEALGQIGPDDRTAFLALVETLTDPDERVRKAAVEALGRAGAVAVPALRRACRDENEGVRVAAASALWGMKGQRQEAGRVLRSVMLEGKETADRIEACQALWKLERAREVVPVLCLLLRDGPDRSAAAEALCKLDGAQDDVRAFLKPLLQHELRSVRAAAWQVLDRIDPDLTTALAAVRPPAK
jgi:HEAT repeat protein